jgi:hypothetical protein
MTDPQKAETLAVIHIPLALSFVNAVTPFLQFLAVCVSIIASIAVIMSHRKK